MLTRIVKINGLLVQGRKRGREIHFADDFMIARDVHHQEVIAGDSAQANRIGGITVAYPVPAVAGVMQQLQIVA